MRRYTFFIFTVLCAVSCKDPNQTAKPKETSSDIAAQDSYDRRRDDQRRQQRQYDINRDRRLSEEQQAAQRRMQAQKQEQQTSQQRLDTAKQEDNAAQNRLDASRQADTTPSQKSNRPAELVKPAPEPIETSPLPGPS